MIVDVGELVVSKEDEEDCSHSVSEGKENENQARTTAERRVDGGRTHSARANLNPLQDRKPEIFLAVNVSKEERRRTHMHPVDPPKNVATCPQAELSSLLESGICSNHRSGLKNRDREFLSQL